MFYTQSKNWYIWLKSDKDRFWIGPFEAKLKDNQIKELITNFKTYKHIGWVWQNKNFVFEYQLNWLNLIYNEFEKYSNKQISIFVVNKIWETDFIQESKFINFFKVENFNIQNKIYGWILKLSQKEFVDKLPILNGFINKFWFLHQVNLPIKEELVQLSNVYDLKFDEDKIKKIPYLIEKIKKYVDSWKLLTYSKRQEFTQQLQEAIFQLISQIIKIYFLLYQTIQNQKELQQITKSNFLQEYKSQAQLLEKTSWFHIEKLVNRLNFMVEQVSLVEEFFRNFSKNLW